MICMSHHYCLHTLHVCKLVQPTGLHRPAAVYQLAAMHTAYAVLNAIQDAIARAPKFLCLYKKTGQRVIINHGGDMLVRPSFIETSLIKKPFGKLAASPA